MWASAQIILFSKQLYANGTLFVGENIGANDGTTGACIDFANKDSASYSTNSASSGNYSSAFIGTRVYNYSSPTALNDKTEMLFFIGNNVANNNDDYGPDRFNFVGAEFRINTFSSDKNPGANVYGKDAVDAIGSAFVNTTPRFIVKSNGDVGIGTDSPAKQLHINNGIGIAELLLTGNSDTTGYGQTAGDGFRILHRFFS